MDINDPTHLTGHVCVDASCDEDDRVSLSPGVRRKTGGETDIYQELDRDCV